MRASRLRFVAVWLALFVLVALPQAATAATVSIQFPQSVAAGLVSAVTLQLPAQVRAIEGRVLVAPGSAELIGVAPAGKGTALSPVSTSTGYVFGAYGLTAKGSKTTMRLIILPKISGNLDVRVLIDAAADARGNRLSLASNELTGSLNVAGAGTRYSAPAGSARGVPPRAAGAIRPVFGRPQITTDNLDVVRASWYSTHGRSTTCNPGLDAPGDANGDGCVDIVDMQAVVAAQGKTVASAPASSGSPTRPFRLPRQTRRARSSSPARPTRRTQSRATASAPTQAARARCARH